MLANGDSSGSDGARAGHSQRAPCAQGRGRRGGFSGAHGRALPENDHVLLLVSLAGSGLPVSRYLCLQRCFWTFWTPALTAESSPRPSISTPRRLSCSVEVTEPPAGPSTPARSEVCPAWGPLPSATGRGGESVHGHREGESPTRQPRGRASCLSRTPFPAGPRRARHLLSH